MLDHDWPLILFTLILQMSAGGFLFLTLASLLNKELSKTSFFRKKMLWLFVLSFAGLILAFFHLGNPLHAINALNNLGSSWISMEILCVAILIFTLFLLNLNYRKLFRFHKGIIALLFAITIISSLILIYSMGRIYIEPTIESWDTPLTWFEFFNSAIVLGGIFILTGFEGKSNKSARLYILLSIGLMIFCDLLLMQKGLQILQTNFFYIAQILMCLSLLSIGMIIFSSPGNKKKEMIMLYILLILIIAEELQGRISFYGAYQSVGI